MAKVKMAIPGRNNFDPLRKKFDFELRNNVGSIYHQLKNVGLMCRVYIWDI